ncbi:NAD(P)-dependent oxidoreductase [Yinghuangia seranimata]|uniref:NAD(P)-dependent oxidoreductase n=1 Tax=Yinghuangia seranimata TaxID=408067 RepID=UPI00248CD64B|nr:NAD(P)H-binding protein [Yinghuangia seranimata]MDI2127737.1 NAD(P)H-binding protein [Yinghuangia seranimata]
MRLTILAATGGVGRHVLAQALDAGHTVTAVVRDPSAVTDTRAATVAADLATVRPAALAGAFDGADAVLSALGARGADDARADVVRNGTRAAVAAMRQAGVRRLVAVSASPVGTVASPQRPSPPSRDAGDGFLAGRVGYPVLKAVMRDRYADLARMEDELRMSGLDWTALRVVRMTDAPLTGRYRTEVGRNVTRGGAIGRADVAHCMLAVLEGPDIFAATLGLAR